MKRIFLLLAIITIIDPSAIHAEHATIILPNIGKVSLDFQPVPDSAENYKSIKIESAGKSIRFTPKNPIAYITVDQKEKLSRGLWGNPSGVRLDPSRLFFRGEFTSDSQPHTLLFFVSEGYASEASPLLVIGFSYLGEPYKVLELDSFDLIAFQQESDNTALILGKKSLSQVMGGDGGNGSQAPYATTYDPFAVYVLHVEGLAAYSLAASKRYNEEHYVWAGSHSREDYAVFYNLPKHSRPVGAPASKLEDLLGTAKVKSHQ
jgi:hypothetical protein